MVWEPKRTLAECMHFVTYLITSLIPSFTGNAILYGPGMPFEMEHRLVDGRVLRVYKNLWPSLRAFWLWAADQFKDKTYIVYENERLTFGESFQQSLLAAAIFKEAYGVSKGDRIAICSRNLPQYIVAFWACQLLGAVPVLVNA